MLPFTQLLLAACQSHVFPELHNKDLLSICQFWGSNFTAFFHKFHVQLNRDDITITGQRDPITGLYYIDLPEPPHVAPTKLHNFACSAYEMKTKAELVQYLHWFSFIPVVRTWTKAIDAGYFATWTGLTSDLVRKHLPKLLENGKRAPQTIPAKHTINQTFNSTIPYCPPKPA